MSELHGKVRSKENRFLTDYITFYSDEDVISKVETLPLASLETLGKIYQYIGNTTSAASIYTQGYFYKCIVTSGVYSWQRIDVQPSHSPVTVVDNLSSTSATSALSANQGRVLNSKKIEHYDIMPTAGATYNNNIVQYIGTTTANYINGYFYKCIQNGGVYSWTRVNTQPSSESGDFEEITNKVTSLTQSSTNTQYPSAKCVYDELADKADIDGNYPLLEVGKAKDIAGADKVDAEIVFRTAGGSADIGSGTATIDKILGNSYAWNQLVQSVDIAETTVNGITYSFVGGKLSVNGTATATVSIPLAGTKVIEGHKYAVLAKATDVAGTNDTLIYQLGINTWTISASIKNGDSITTGIEESTDSEFRFRIASGVTLTNYSSYITIHDLTLIFGSGNEPATVSALKATPIGAFICSGYHSYDAGSLLSSKETGMKTVGFNQWDEQWELGYYSISTGEKFTVSTQICNKNSLNIFPNTKYYCKVPIASGVALYILWYDANANYLSYNYATNNVVTSPSNARYANFYLSQDYGVTYNNDIAINLSWSGIRNGEYEPYWASQLSLPVTTITGKLNGAGSSVVVFPDGMKSVGSVRDEIVKVDGQLKKAVRRCGVVDLGTLNWNYNSNYGFYSSQNLDAKTVLSELSPTNIITAKFVTMAKNSVTTSNNGISLSAQCAVVVSSTLTDAAAFKTAMSGVYLIYELATPQEYVLDSAINSSYRIDDFGTEEIVPAQGSTPTSAPLYLSVEYGLNAKDAIRNLPKNYVSAQGDDNTLSRIESTLASVYGITMTHTWDSTNGRYNIAMSGGWQPVASAPASASATGSKGQYFIDSAYLYVAVGTNTWRRISLSTW